MSEPTGAARRRGPFKVGDQVQLTDPKGRHYTFTLEAGKNFHTHKGSFPHDELIGAPEGSVVRTTGNVAYLALRPLLPDYVLSMPRGAAVVYPKDAGQILAFADIFPGARVVEAGVGSGSLSSFLLRAIGDEGMLHSYERREDFAEIAQATWSATSADRTPPGAHRRRPPGQSLRRRRRPRHPGHARPLGVPGGRLQGAGPRRHPVLLRGDHDAARADRRVHPRDRLLHRADPWESMIRNWHVEGLAVRPDHRMIGHTGFLVTARRLADGVEPPMRRRRPAKGAYGEDYEGPNKG